MKVKGRVHHFWLSQSLSLSFYLQPFSGVTRHLSKILRSIHQGIKYPCDQCDYKATQKGDLLTHLKSIHEGVKYPCDQCDYKATQKCHLLTHSNSKHHRKVK